MQIPYLSLSDIQRVGLTFDDCTDIVEQSFREHAAGEVQNPPKLPVHPLPDAFINAMPAYLPRKSACGVKWISGFPTNVGKGLPALASLLVLNDPETGFPIAVMEAAYLTALRTVAVSAVATKHLCNPDATVMALVGCGIQGKYHALALPHVVPSITTLQVADNYEPSVTSFVEAMRERAPELAVEECSTPEQAIRGADLVVTATGKLLEPIFEHAWVGEGALLLPVHTLGWDSATASRMDKLIVDDWAQYRTVGETHYAPLPERPHAETGEVVAGTRPGRESPRERIVNFNKGIAIHDILMASVLLERAKAAGIGGSLTLDEPEAALPMLSV